MNSTKPVLTGDEPALNPALHSHAVENSGLPRIRISALIPAYNRERTIARAIESVLAQEVPPSEVVVVDDGSNDRTRSIVATFGDKVRLVCQTNAGVSAARNRCVKEARHDWLAFLDSDDYWLPGHLRRMSAAIQATYGEAALYFSDLVGLPDEGAHSYWQKCGLQVRPPFELKPNGTDWAFMPIQPMMFQASVVRRDRYLESGGLPEELYTREDTLLFFKLCLSYPICAVSGCGTVLMDDGGERLTRKFENASLEYARASIIIYEKLTQFQGAAHNGRAKMIAQALSTAHFAMARANYRQKIYGGCLQSILRSGVTSPVICANNCLESLRLHLPRSKRGRPQRTEYPRP